MLMTARVVLWSATGISPTWFVCVHVCRYGRAFAHAFGSWLIAVVPVRMGASVSFLLGCLYPLG